MTRGALRLTACLLASCVLTGCDAGPSGPGTISGTVVGAAPLGAALIEVTGVGITGFTGQGDTQVYGALVSDLEGRHRVLLVDQGGGQLQFGIRVDDLGADRPIVSVLDAASPENEVVSTAGVEVRIEG